MLRSELLKFTLIDTAVAPRRTRERGRVFAPDGGRAVLLRNLRADVPFWSRLL